MDHKPTWLHSSYQSLIVAVSAIALVGLIVRLLFFPHNIYFAYDQARDAFVSRAIYSQHDIKIQGPQSSLQGVYHGPLFYYIIGLLYTVFHGDPTWVTFFFILLNVFCIPLLFATAYILTKRIVVGLLAAMLLAFSFEQTQWAIFISNTSLANFGIACLLFGLAVFWFAKKTYGLIIASLGFSIAVQSEVYLFYLVVPIALVLRLLRKTEKPKLTRGAVITSCLILTGAVSTYVVSEVLFGFPILKHLFAIAGKAGTLDLTPYEQVVIIINRFGLISYYTIFGYSSFYALVFLAFCVILVIRSPDAIIENVIQNTTMCSQIDSDIFEKKQQILNVAVNIMQARKFILPFLFGSITLLLLPVGFANVYHFSIGASLLVLILVAVVLATYAKGKTVMSIVIALLVLGQLHLISTINRTGARLTAVQKRMLLGDERAIVAYIANASGTIPVGITALTNPYNVTTLWAYIFQQYWPKDKALPVWMGSFAKGYPGEYVFRKAKPHLPCTYFVVYEPADGIPDYLVNPFIDDETNRSWQLVKKRFGAFTVEKRRLFYCMDTMQAFPNQAITQALARTHPNL